MEGLNVLNCRILNARYGFECGPDNQFLHVHRSCIVGGGGMDLPDLISDPISRFSSMKEGCGILHETKTTCYIPITSGKKIVGNL